MEQKETNAPPSSCVSAEPAGRQWEEACVSSDVNRMTSVTISAAAFIDCFPYIRHSPSIDGFSYICVCVCVPFASILQNAIDNLLSAKLWEEWRELRRSNDMVLIGFESRAYTLLPIAFASITFD